MAGRAVHTSGFAHRQRTGLTLPCPLRTPDRPNGSPYVWLQRASRMKYSRELALCVVTMLWGATFLVIRFAMEECGPMFFVGLRFGSAALVLLAVSLPVLGRISREELVGGIILGITVFGGFGLQTAGLVTLDVAKSAFLSAFYVPLVPLLDWLIRKRRPSRRAFISLSLAFAGVILLSGGTGMSLEGSRGEMITLGCALLFAMEIVLTGIIAPRCNIRLLSLVMLTVTSLLGFALMPVTGEAVPDLSAFVLLSGCALGAVSALIQTVIVWAQKTIPPSRAALIYTGEPVWGGFFGYLAGERLAPTALVGCGLVLSGLLFSAGRKKPAARPAIQTATRSATQAEDALAAAAAQPVAGTSLPQDGALQPAPRPEPQPDAQPQLQAQLPSDPQPDSRSGQPGAVRKRREQ